MTARRACTRHGLTAPMARVKLRGFTAIDRRTAAARAMLDFRRDLVSSLGGEADLSPQRRRLIDMTARAALLLDHVDAWLAEQTTLVNRRTRSLFPIVLQRTQLAEHLARLLDKLGLDKIPTRVEVLDEYVKRRYGGAQNGSNGSPGATAGPTRAASEAPAVGITVETTVETIVDGVDEDPRPEEGA